MNIYSKIKGILVEKLGADPIAVEPERTVFLSKGQQGSEHHARLRASGGRGKVRSGEWGGRSMERYETGGDIGPGGQRSGGQRGLTLGQRRRRLRQFRRRTTATHLQR